MRVGCLIRRGQLGATGASQSSAMPGVPSFFSLIVDASDVFPLSLTVVAGRKTMKIKASFFEVLLLSVRDGIRADPPLCRESSQGKHGSCAKRLGCEGENVAKIGELVLVVSVRCGKERRVTRG